MVDRQLDTLEVKGSSPFSHTDDFPLTPAPTGATLDPHRTTMIPLLTVTTLRESWRRPRGPLSRVGAGRGLVSKIGPGEFDSHPSCRADGPLNRTAGVNTRQPTVSRDFSSVVERRFVKSLVGSSSLSNPAK